MNKRKRNYKTRTKAGQLLLGGLLAAGLTALIGAVTLLSIVATRHPTNGAYQRLDNGTATDQDMQNIQDSQQDFSTSLQIAAAGGGLVGQSGPVPGTGVTDLSKSILEKDLQASGVKAVTDAYTGKVAGSSMDNTQIWTHVVGRWKNGSMIMRIYERDNGSYYEGVYETVPESHKFQYKVGDFVFTDLVTTSRTTYASRHGYSYPLTGDDVLTGPYSDTSLTIKLVTDRILDMTSNCPKYGKSGNSKYFKWHPEAIGKDVTTWNRVD